VRVLALVGVTAAAWLALVPAAVLIDGPGHWLAGSAAAALCLVPAAGTLALLRATEHRPPVEAIGAVLVAPVARMLVVLPVGAGLWRAVPGLHEAPVRFAGWVLTFYLITLVAEAVLAMPRSGRPAAGGEEPGAH
jgi:hypothetical protein